MSKSSVKRRNIYVYHPKYRSQITCLIHGHVNSSDECKFFDDFGSKYAKVRYTKDHSQESANKKIWNAAR